MKDEKDRKLGEGVEKYRDLALFGQVISTGLVVVGYVFAGVYLARWMEARGYPAPLVAFTPFGMALFGLWQGWLVLRRIAKRKKR